MAIAQAQYVDLLVKQLYGVAKTDTNTIKSPSNESIASPALIRGDTQWTQSDQIPATAAALAGVVQAYTGASAIECAPDTTTVPVGGVYPTWLTNLTNWIPQEFGSTYVVQAWVDSPGVANPTLTGTQIFASGVSGTGEYYYDNIAGLLNFIGGTIPSALTSSKVIYIVGYRYIGLVGVTHLPSNTAIGNLNFTGTTISSTNLNGNIIITPNGTGTVLISSAVTINANITANFFIGNGSQLTGVAASNAVTAGTVTASAQPNITSVGTLISLDVTGNVTGGNFIGPLANGNSNVYIPVANGNINLTSDGVTTLVVTNTGSNIAGTLNVTTTATVGNLTVNSNGNITGANVVSANTFSGNLTATSSNVTSNSITNNLTVNLEISGNTASFTGNILTLNANLGNAASANYFIGNGSLLTGVAASNAVTAGTVTANAQPNITSVGTLISLDITGNLTAGNANLGNLVIANFFSGSGNMLSNIQGANVSGQVANALVAGTVYTNAQPNITSVGTLTSLNVSGASNLGPVGNVTITGGTNGYYLQTNGSGTLTWAAVPTGTTISNGNSNINIPVANGNINITATGNSVMVITGNGVNVTGTLNATGNLTAVNANLGNSVTANYFIGNLYGTANLATFATTANSVAGANVSGQVANALVAGTVYTNAQPNITTVGTLTSLTVTGNTISGNVYANSGTIGANLLTGTLTTNAQPNITSVGTLTSLTITGNITGGNVYANSGTIGANLLTGTLTTNAQPNITSVGTLTTLTVTGNVNTGNINAGSGTGGNITGGNLVSANYFTGTLTTNAQPNITSVGTLTSLDVSGHLVANTFQMGYGIYAFYSTSVFFATTASTSANQILWDYPAADLSAIDFTIIATDSVGSTRQSCKISAAILGTTVAYNEYGGLFINGGVGSFSVIYNPSGPAPTLQLVVTPDSSNLTEYNMLISKYLV